MSPMRRPDPTELDPLFYRGKTPVLGEETEVKLAGGLPSEFPAAGGPAPAPGTAPAAPARPALGPMPEMPRFEFPEFSFEWGEAPMPPNPYSFDITAPGAPSTPWWAQALGVGKALGSGASAVDKLNKAGQAPTGQPGWMDSGAQFSLFGPETGAYDVAGQGFSLTGPEADILAAGGEVPQDFTQGMRLLGPEAQAAAGPGINVPGLLGGLAQTGGGIYGMVASEPGQPGFGMGALNTAAGLGTTAGSLGVGGVGAGSVGAGLTALGPTAALVSLPIILGQLVNSYFGADKARFPEGYQLIPGSTKSGGAGAMAVDPATGRMLVYRGNGQYEWAEETQAGILPTPDQFRQWEISPAGALAGQAGYGAVPKELQDLRIRRNQPTPADVNASVQQIRTPKLQEIQASMPGASEAQVWNAYTQTPEYQTEQAMQSYMTAGPVGTEAESGRPAPPTPYPFEIVVPPGGGGPRLTAKGQRDLTAAQRAALEPPPLERG